MLTAVRMTRYAFSGTMDSKELVALVRNSGKSSGKFWEKYLSEDIAYQTYRAWLSTTVPSPFLLAHLTSIYPELYDICRKEIYIA